ncbi:hypothetical protein BV22DRAFT_1134211 [Leucogyrophana mollusca]|uniref:Uncharacterized protein n=1 Tax=Leucogyrophana mollusca TaxID=85980 RepID=A0ACB8AZV7_9AGAM|nr:hypothetical protein BV22DRAFT_1134211 [Leucogyrophana mollusca]
MLVSASLDTNHWTQIPFPSSDVIIIQFSSPYGKFTLFNIYNNGTSRNTLTALERFLLTHIQTIRPSADDYMIWLGDFSRHHPLWDEERNGHLFTNAALTEAEVLIDLLADYRMVQLPPKDTPTLQATSTCNWTRPDNVFGSENINACVIQCGTNPALRGLRMDHVPILTVLSLPTPTTSKVSSPNYQETNWEKFNEILLTKLALLPPPCPLLAEGGFQPAMVNLAKAIVDTVVEAVPISKPNPHSKRWWTYDLMKLRREKNKLSHMSCKMRAFPDHPCHEQHHCHIPNSHAPPYTIPVSTRMFSASLRSLRLTIVGLSDF